MFYEVKVKSFERNLKYEVLKVSKGIDVLLLLCEV
jgi:hypothetical protein